MMKHSWLSTILQDSDSRELWVLGGKPGSSERVTDVLNNGAISLSPAHPSSLLLDVCFLEKRRGNYTTKADLSVSF